LLSTNRHARLAAAAAALAVGTAPLLFSVGADAAAPSTATTPRIADYARGPIEVDLLAINDFHGQLEKVASGSSSNVPTGADPDGSGPLAAPNVLAGGAAYLGWHLGALRADAAERGAKTLTVAAGDLIGATPLLSAASHDEPTIETMNLLGLDITSVGNHEFDEGWRELVRLQNGGCKDDDGDDDPYQDSCPGGKSFAGADFQYLSANVIRKKTGNTVFPAYQIERVGKANGEAVKMAFVGMTLEDTPNIVTAAGVKGLEFIDEVQAVKNVLPELRRQGVKSIVVLLHEGGTPQDNNYTYDGCATVTGPGAEIARTLPAAVDVVVSGHTHQAYNCVVQDPQGNDRLFTSAFSIGRIVTDIGLEIDRATGDVIRPSMKAENHIVTNTGPGVRPRASVVDLINRYKELVAPIANQILGKIAPAETVNSVSRTADADGESPLGNLIADAQLADESVVADGVAPTIAFMNPGGIRADLSEDPAGNVTYEKAFNVQPFNNFLVSLSLTGQDVLDLLNEQWNGANEGASNRWKILQVAGISYTWDKTAAGQTSANALVADTVKVDGDGDGDVDDAIDPEATYRVVTNNFLADGGDGFATFKDGTDRFNDGDLDIVAFADYLAANNPYTAVPTNRISSVTAP
jgi:5'-nucleotidase